MSESLAAALPLRPVSDETDGAAGHADGEPETERECHAGSGQPGVGVFAVGDFAEQQGLYEYCGQ